MDEASISERLAEAASLLRSPLARDRAGNLTEVGNLATLNLRGVLNDLPTVPVESTADALAMLMRDTIGVMIENSTPNALAVEAMSTTAMALERMGRCLEALSDRTAEELDIGGRGWPKPH